MILRTFVFMAVIMAAPVAATAQIKPAPTPSASPSDICSQGLSAIVSRPTQTTSACVVEPAHILIESGFQAASITGGNPYAVQSYPNVVIRIGTIIPRVELDVQPPNVSRSGGTTFAGDVGFGVKFQMPASATFAYGANVLLTIPSGSDPTTPSNPNGLGSSNGLGYIGNLNVQGSLGKVVGYGASAGFNSLAFPLAPNATTRYFSFIPSVDLTFTLRGATFFVEGYLQSSGEGPGTSTHTWFDAGVTKDIGKAQYDLEFGSSNAVLPSTGGRAIRRRYVGVGISYGF